MLKQRLRYGLVLLAGIVAGGQAVGAYQAWRLYRDWRARNPATAETYLVFARTEALLAAMTVAIAALVWWLLRPAPGAVRR